MQYASSMVRRIYHFFPPFVPLALLTRERTNKKEPFALYDAFLTLPLRILCMHFALFAEEFYVREYERFAIQ